MHILDEILAPFYSARWRIGRTIPVGFMAKWERHFGRKMLAFPICQPDNFVRVGVEIIDACLLEVNLFIILIMPVNSILRMRMK